MSAAVGALSGPLHGGAPARVLPMLDEVAKTGDPEGYVKNILEQHGRIMGFGHRVYRAEDPRSRILKRTAQELGSPRIEVAEALEEAALAELHKRKPDYVIATNVEFYSAVLLDAAEVPPELTPAMFACSRVAGWSAHILEQKRTGRLFRPADRYVGPGPRSLSALSDARVSRCRGGLARRAGRGARARRAPDAVAGRARGFGPFAGLPRARRRVPGDRAVPLPAEDGAPAARARGREPRVPRLGADLARAPLARPSRARQRRCARSCTSSPRTTTTRPCAGSPSICLDHGSPQRETILLLSSIADDDEQDKELRAAAGKIGERLRKKGAARR